MGETYAVPRLGIPSICLNDGPAGLRLVKNVTGFPSGINSASTFSRRLMRARGEAMAEEFRGKGVKYVSIRFIALYADCSSLSVLLGPAMDIVRSACIFHSLDLNMVIDEEPQSGPWMGKVL